MNPLRPILLAEDDPNDVRLTLEAFSAHRLVNEVIVVGDGVEALEWLQQRGRHAAREPGYPAVVLLDIKMPRLDGLEVLRRVKTDPQLKAVPVVMLTSSREERDLVAGYAHGANGFVVKPVEFGEFMAAVGSLGVYWALVNEPPPRIDPHA
jgi:CheY-like chemotaxis protein